MSKDTVMGRPTKYTDDMPDKVWEYVQSCKDSYEKLEDTDKDGNPIFISRPFVNIPTKAGLSLYLGIAKSTINEWEKEYPDFSVALEKLSSMQEVKMINGGLAGVYNSTIAKLGLSNNHGYREKTEQDITSGGEKISINFDNAFAPNTKDSSE